MAELDRLWAELAPDTAGLVAAVVVHARDGRVLMLGYMNREALGATITTAKVTFYSRSRACLWQKGESSGNSLALESIRVDCDGDALASLWQTILDRKAGRGMTNREGRSYVRALLDKGVAKINGKISEEAGELATALAEESDERVANEAADLLFHALVGLAARELEPADVAAVLRARHGLSGVDEKAQR